MRIPRLLPVLCLLGGTACTDAEILGPAPAPSAEAAARPAEESAPPQVALENCVQIVIVELDAQGRPITPP